MMLACCSGVPKAVGPTEPKPSPASQTPSPKLSGPGPWSGWASSRGRSLPSSPRFLAGVRDMDRRFDAAVKSAVLSQKVDQGRRPRRLRSTRRAGVGRESRRALCWHRPPVLYPRGATRAKLCKCCQGQTPQNFDRVLAAACLYRDMLSCQTHLSESAMMAQHSDVGRRRRLQKPYQSLRARAYPWKLQDCTLDHLCRG